MSRKKRKPIDWGQVKRDLLILKEAGYRVRGKVITHWKVSKKGTDRVVEVWPTTRKFMVSGARGAQMYADVLKAVGDSFRGARKNNDEAKEVWREGLKKLLEKLNLPF